MGNLWKSILLILGLVFWYGIYLAVNKDQWDTTVKVIVALIPLVVVIITIWQMFTKSGVVND